MKADLREEQVWKLFEISNLRFEIVKPTTHNLKPAT
jgi:hypothetical protein